MFEGQTVLVGGKEYIFADFNFRAVKQIFPLFHVINDPLNPGYMAAVSQIILIGLQRNYPDVSEEFLELNLEISELPAIMEVITYQLTKKKSRVTPAQMTSLSSGENSTPELLPQPAGAGNTSTIS